MTSTTTVQRAPSSNWRELQEKLKQTRQSSSPAKIPVERPTKRRRKDSSPPPSSSSSSPSSHHRPPLKTVHREHGAEQSTLKIAESISSAPLQSEMWFADDLRNDRDRQLAQDLVTQPDKIVAPVEDLKGKRKATLDELLGTPSLPTGRKAKPGEYVALDCEFVGVGPDAEESMLARVSIVNYFGVLVYDTFVRPKEAVTDYRTFVSGVREQDLRDAPTFEEVARKVADIIEGKILVGHAIHNDTQALMLKHPSHAIRDTARHAPIHDLAKTKRPALKKIAKLFLGIDIQAGEHSSIDDARATMAVYRHFKDDWEAAVRKGQRPAPIADNSPRPTLAIAGTLKQIKRDAATQQKGQTEPRKRTHSDSRKPSGGSKSDWWREGLE
ncbi:uncharacterized protein L969DRAFT_96846 [Mixia osmundae IAM 14324]|uniref:RNA exonuclease 4 n=1 Tax=Mixia osmundae (strain CBS 9802 / IAM 14324 / JCM 22182 / KY 12970) TaxID=764103 RepID=G7E295_MIXOS|nr:uncharacterized protein L969DRAFT_96846 [Mixia osmundae IAM 14324]KEI36828.1 hypothetical protein L969DRAFT_96846 [Mixia osmundae IAM 14324]GAA96955.1 hypothetical protein E5Q_03629 [Mixia osmundae IAM 14324]